ncbi:methyltransferase domain-containing protein [Streptomyces marincola]|uniref:methyltransferase domain-containing protein n=1 Tax=Streptomyces marincola TaxID=2878388 RepID=UPI001CF5F226|nr:methyltransferase domain-containing protein [Streptomyces marincola]UCM86555.1 methyltransferase domain-containing protein [Streptomyces marincola]
MTTPLRDTTEYDEWSGQWWDPRGPFSTLSWIARQRASLIPRAPAGTGGTPLLVDVCCGGGLLHPHIADKGYRHVGVDASALSAEVARSHGVDEVIHADVHRVPLPDGCADVVVAGQCLEHVDRPWEVIAECCRLLKPGGLVIADTIADTLLARLAIITLAENVPLSWMAPKGCHDHRMFVNPRRLAFEFARNGVPVQTYGLFPDKRDLLAWALNRTDRVRLRRIASTDVIYQAIGRKPAA